MADLRDADLRNTVAIKADFSGANLTRANLEGADLTTADFTGAYLRAANFSHARMWAAMLRRVSCKNAVFFYTDLTYADFLGGEFLGSRFNHAVLDGAKNLDRAQFYWWVPAEGGKPVYEPRPGYVKRNFSATGGYSYPENAGKRIHAG